MTGRIVSLSVIIGIAACGGAWAQPAEPAGPILQSVFQLARSDAEDVIYFRNNDVLRGEVLNEKLSINTPYGFVQLPLRACAGISFEGARANTEALITINFNRLTGIINDRVIKFKISSSGAEIDIRKEKIRHVLLQLDLREAQLMDPEAKSDLFVMANGDLLSGQPVEKVFTIGTDYADIPVSFKELKMVEMQGGANVTAVATKKNGDVMRGTLQTEEISLDLDIGVEVEAVYKDKFAKVFVDDGNVQVAAQFGVAQPIRGESDGSAFGATAVAAGGPEITNSIGMKLRLIQPGTFKMGSPEDEAGRDDDETPVREITLTKPFYIGVHEVTQAQWAEVMGNNPSNFVGRNRPVEMVSWEDAQAFLKKLSEKENVEYRLPTEAEWEYACRAGTETPYYWGEAWDDAYGWCNENSGGSTHDVGMKKPNAWGLYDMSGNVWEWCQDWYDKYPATFKDTDPPGPSGGSSRVLRGGSWNSYLQYCRSASRNPYYTPAYLNSSHGFRVVRTP